MNMFSYQGWPDDWIGWIICMERQQKLILTFFETRNKSWSIYHILSINTFACQNSIFVNSCKLFDYFRKVKQVYFCHFGIQIGNWFENNWGIQIPRSQILVFESNVKAMTRLQSHSYDLLFSLKTLKYLIWRRPVWGNLQSISYCDITEPFLSPTGIYKLISKLESSKCY